MNLSEVSTIEDLFLENKEFQELRTMFFNISSLDNQNNIYKEAEIRWINLNTDYKRKYIYTLLGKLPASDSLNMLKILIITEEKQILDFSFVMNIDEYISYMNHLHYTKTITIDFTLPKKEIYKIVDEIYSQNELSTIIKPNSSFETSQCRIVALYFIHNSRNSNKTFIDIANSIYNDDLKAVYRESKTLNTLYNQAIDFEKQYQRYIKETYYNH